MRLFIYDIYYRRDTNATITFGLFSDLDNVEPILIGFQIIAYDSGPEEGDEFYESQVKEVLYKMTSFAIDAPPSSETELTYGLSDDTADLEIISIDDSIFECMRIDMAHRNLQIIWNALHKIVRFLPTLVELQRRFKERYHSPEGAGFAVCQSSFEMLSCDS